MDFLHHRVAVQQYVAVPESDDAPAVSRKDARSPRVGLRGIDVLTAVELDDETSFHACEVCKEPADGMLSTKAIAELAIPQTMPKTPFGIGRLPAQFARAKVESLHCSIMRSSRGASDRLHG